MGEIIGLLGLATSIYSLSQSQKQAKRSERQAKANTQLQMSRAPQQATQDPFSASIKKYGGATGIKGNILSNSKKNSTPAVGTGVGTNTTLGQ